MKRTEIFKMIETTGTVALKIARLQRHLQILSEQQRLSAAYPNHQSVVLQEMLRIQTQLQQLLHSQASSKMHRTNYFTESIFNGENHGQKSFGAIN